MNPARSQAKTGSAGPRSDALRWFPALFEESPFGMVVTDGRGAVLSANRLASELLLDGRDAQEGRLRCCELICSQLRSGSFAGATCLTEAALASGDRSLEVRLEAPGGASREEILVRPTPIHDDEARVVMYLFPDYWSGRVAGGRALGGEPRPTHPATVRARTLGPLRIEVNGADVGGDWLQRRPGQLLKYLLFSRHRLAATEQIYEVLWPASPAPWNSGAIRFQVHELRNRLEPDRAGASSRLVLTRRGGYMLNPEELWIDADLFEDKAREGLTLLAQGAGEAAIPPLEAALALYRGDFLSEDPYAEWVLDERDRLREVAERALHALMELRRAAGDLEGATDCARRLASMEPLDMDVQREFLEICIRRGRRSEAMRRYSVIRERMRREFGHDPDFTLADLS